jgi:hypothetical protein
MKHLTILASVLVLATLAGCSGKDQVIEATGTAALDAYADKNLSRGQVIAMAKRAALLDAQRNLLETYAGTFLDSETDVKNFVTQNDRVISRTGGMLRGVHKVGDKLSPDQSAWIVTVRAHTSELKAQLNRR